MNRFACAGIIAFASLLFIPLAGCRSEGAANGPFPPDQAALARDQGYAILYATIKDESRVDGLLIVKGPSPPVAETVKAIAEFSRSTKERLETLAKEAPPLDLEHQGLPPAESETRKSISSATAKSLLSSRGGELDLRLLLTQHEALKYVSHLAITLSEHEPNASRAEYLKKLAGEARVLDERVVAQLAVTAPRAVR